MPKISVIVPVYRVEPYLHRCIDSILGQTYIDLELILVDDGSPDNCGAICDEYAQKDSRVHVIHQENGGLSAARNAGMDWVFANSDSQWITFIDSDDWIHHAYLETMILAAEQHSVTQVMCDDIETDHFMEDAAVPEDCVQVVDPEYAYVHHYAWCMTACDKILHRSLLENLRFPVGKLHEDAYVTHLMTFASDRIALCHAKLYYYYCNPGSITRVKWSEKRLEEFEGHEVRLSYLQKSGYTKAYVTELEVYAFMLFAQLQDLRLLSKKEKCYRNHMKELRVKAVEVFREARKHGLFPYRDKNLWIYELVYPIKPVWFVRNIWKKLINS